MDEVVDDDRVRTMTDDVTQLIIPVRKTRNQ